MHLSNARGTIAVDDLHRVDGDIQTMAFLSAAIECNKTSLKWIIAARALRNLPIIISKLECSGSDQAVRLARSHGLI